MTAATTEAMPPVAWQRLVRERRRAEDSDADLFGRWWESIDLDIARTTIREVDYATAKSVIVNYEWLGNMPAGVLHCYGLYFDGHCGGVVVYANETAENLGVYDAYGYSGKIIRVARGACVHWAHPHSATRLIRGSMRMLPAKYEVVTASVDRRAGEIGTIYQACGFHYVGVMSYRTPHRGAILNGRKLSSRTFTQYRQKLQVSAQESVRFGYSLSDEPRKERYFAFRGSKRAKRTHLAAIQHLVKPYPKRAASGLERLP